MTPFQFPAGITNLASKNQEIVNWRECHLIRWDNGVTLRPIGGWEQMDLAPFPSILRKMHRWASNAGIIYTAFLCEAHVFVQAGVGSPLVDITPAGGLIPPETSAGYGNDNYNRYTYGSKRPGPPRVTFLTPQFTLDNWGEELRAMSSADGRYLGWSPISAPGTLLTAVTNAPTGNRSFIITPERHAMLFGMNDFAKFGWSDEEDDTSWTFTDVLSRAGFFDVSPRTPIVTQQLFETGIIMFTTTMSYIIEWQGLPYVYGMRPIGKIGVPFSPASICDTPVGVVWPSIDGCWLWDGEAASVIPCAVWDNIMKDINIQQTNFTAACVHVSNKGEVWWFYADNTALPGLNNRYAMYDYRSLVWSMGKLNRTCGYVYANEPNPIMSDGTLVWKHESGFNYPGAELPWIESMNLNANGGENWFTLNRILPDVAGDMDAVRFRMAKTNDRSGYTPDVYSPQRAKNGSGYVDIRETARDMRLRLDMVKNSDWGTLGPILFDIKQRGRK